VRDQRSAQAVSRLTPSGRNLLPCCYRAVWAFLSRAIDYAAVVLLPVMLIGYNAKGLNNNLEIGFILYEATLCRGLLFGVSCPV
jgi:hypothetical protein